MIVLLDREEKEKEQAKQPLLYIYTNTPHTTRFNAGSNNDLGLNWLNKTWLTSWENGQKKQEAKLAQCEKKGAEHCYVQ